MSQRWTLTYAGDEKSFAEWKLQNPRRRLIQQSISFVALTSKGERYDADTQFAQGATITIKKIVRNDSTAVETSTVWFVGRVEQPERFGNQFGEGISYLLVDVVYYLSETIYQIAWKEHATPGDPSSALVDKYLSEIFLNKSITDTALTTRQQMADALQWCLTVMARPVNGSIVPFQFNANEFTAMNIPVDKVVDAPCLNVLIKQLRFMPDAVMWVDYATTPPTIHIKRRSALTPVSINVAGKPTEEIQIKARYDLQRPSVVLNFRIINSNNGTPLRETVTQIAGGTGDEFRAVISTINLEGFSVGGGSSATITRASILADNFFVENRVAWWKTKIPWLNDARVASLTITQAVRNNPAGFPFEVVTGQIPPTSGVNSRREIIRAVATYNILNQSDVRWRGVTQPIDVEITATSATTDTFTSGSSSASGEPVPDDLADDYFEGVSFLPWEGTITFAERELTSPISLGNVLNLTGGRTEWETMNAVVQQIEEDMETGKTTVTFGPPTHLGIADLVELLRFNSERFVWGSNAARVSGAADSGGSVVLGSHTALQNSNAAVPEAQMVKLVGANIANIINLDTALCGGNELKPISMSICEDGVSKTLWLVGKIIP